MIEQVQETSTPAETPIEEVATFDERLTRLHEAIRDDRGAPAAVEVNADAKAVVEEPAKVEVASADVDAPDLEKIRAERRAALQRLTDTERASAEKRRARAAQAPPAPTSETLSELETLRQRVAALEPLESAFKDEQSFLLAARERGMNPMKFGELLKETITNPEFITEQKLKAYEQKLLDVEKRVDQKVAEKLAEIEAKSRASTDEAAERAAAKELIDLTNGSARTAPLSAAFLERHGAESFVSFATNVAQSLPPGVGLERVHDALEVALEHLQLGSAPPAPSQSKSKPPDAPVKAKTVTNQLASSRTTVADDDVDWSSLPFNERMKMLRK